MLDRLRAWWRGRWEPVPAPSRRPWLTPIVSDELERLGVPPAPSPPPLPTDTEVQACYIAGHPYWADDPVDKIGRCRCGYRWFTPTPEDTDATDP